MLYLALNNQIHQLSNWLITIVFPSPYPWIHVIVHLVLVAMPLGFLGLLVVWLIRLVRRLLSGRPTVLPRDLSSPFPPNLFTYILKHSRRTQLVLLAAALVSLPLLYAALELPKQIINLALNGDSETVAFLGTSLSRYEILILFCALYLAAALGGGSVKYFINVTKGHLAEGMTRRMRFSAFRAWSRGKEPCEPSRIIPMLIQEFELIAGFTSVSFLAPILEGGTLLTVLVFMISQNPVLGAAALTLVPIQVALIPRLQRRVRALSRERSREMRSFGATVAGAAPRHHHHHHQYSRPVLAIANSLKKVQAIRLEIYRRKFFIKGLNNLLSHLTPFFFYTIGGYLVIDGRLSLGALVAVLAAHKELSSPLRHLLDYYQTLDDARVRYEDIRQFLGEKRECSQPDRQARYGGACEPQSMQERPIPT